MSGIKVLFISSAPKGRGAGVQGGALPLQKNSPSKKTSCFSYGKIHQTRKSRSPLPSGGLGANNEFFRSIPRPKGAELSCRGPLPELELQGVDLHGRGPWWLLIYRLTHIGALGSGGLRLVDGFHQGASGFRSAFQLPKEALPMGQWMMAVLSTRYSTLPAFTS